MRDANIYTQFIPTLFHNKEKTTEFLRWHLTIWWLRGDSNPRHTENKLRDVGTFGSWEDKKFQGYDDLEIGVIRISQHQQNTLVVAGYSKSTELPPKGYMIPTSNH